jgi:hypothetical protein
MPIGLAFFSRALITTPRGFSYDQSASLWHNVASLLQAEVIVAAAFGTLGFGAGYLLYRLGALLFLEFGLRGVLNRNIGGTLKGLALGRDGGLQVADVSTQSHHFGTRETVLAGAVAERMNAASGEATRRLFDKYRNSLFSVGADASNAVVEIARDSMTWDSLIHTTYFDQPEVAETIAEGIAAAAAGAS